MSIYREQPSQCFRNVSRIKERAVADGYTLRLGIFETPRLLNETPRFELCHRQVVQKVVSAIHRRRAWHFTAIRSHMLERRPDELLDLARHDFVRRVRDEVEPGETPHRPPVHDMVLEPGVAQIRGDDMLYRMHCVGMNGGFRVRTLHADVERRYESAVHDIPSAYEDSVADFRVVHLK